MLSFNELKRLSKIQPKAGSAKVKIALLGDTATQFLHQAIKGFGASQHVEYEIWEADYNQIDRQVFDPGSELYTFKPDYCLILRSSEHLLKTFYKTGLTMRQSFAESQAQYLASLLHEIDLQTKCKIITNTYFEINDGVFGNYATRVPSSFLYQVRKLNLDLTQLALERKNLFLLDLASLLAQQGYSIVFDPKVYINADMTFSMDILPHVAQNIHAIVQAVNGSFRKCLILDLDNTLWGGIIGDDGMEGIRIGDLGIGKAFTDLQLWAKELKNRGIILAVCSKNTDTIAKEPFERHPDMELRLEDIAIFVANWENKVDNIKYIQQVLEIGFDSMVFLDDNTFEREMVKQAIPALTVPDLPEDPAEFVPYLRALNLFETASFTNEDLLRTIQYQEEAQRTVFQRSFANEGEFLQSLDMRSEVSPFTSFTIPRVAQLTQRSNQFNLRTKRYTESEIQSITDDENYLTFSFTLADKFGDHGLISAVILHKQDDVTLFIDTWIMSCRVLKRGMEQFTLCSLALAANQHGYSKLMGEYLPTAKNGIVKDHYQNLGFKPFEDKWILDITGETLNNQTFIKSKHGNTGHFTKAE